MQDAITFAEYMNWAKGQQCTLATGFKYGSDGRCHETLHLECPNGGHYSRVDSTQYDPLTKEDVTKIDERLGLNSPFFRT